MKRVYEFSFDDGTSYDLKIAELLNKYKLKGTFYIPINYERKELSDFEVRELAKKHNIGAHTINHYSLNLLSEEMAKSEIIDCKKILETVVDQKIDSFCYPRGRFSPQVKELVRAAGFKEARTTKVFNINLDYDPFEKPTTIHLFPRKEYQGRNIKELAFKYLDKVKSTGGIFHLWGHGFEINDLDLWDDLEDILERVSQEK